MCSVHPLSTHNTHSVKNAEIPHAHTNTNTQTTARQICEGAAGRARRTASVLGVYGQPEDHPFPAACQELRYLKFVTHLLD